MDGKGLPWWLRWLRICLQCRRPGFNSWIGKIPWRREWLPTVVFLPREFHGQKNPAGYSPWGRKESDMTEWLTPSPVKEKEPEEVGKAFRLPCNLWKSDGWGLYRHRLGCGIVLKKFQPGRSQGSPLAKITCSVNPVTHENGHACVLSHFICVQLFATSWTAAH